MGCPMCDWKTALLMVAGLAFLFIAVPYNTFIALGLIITAWVWSMWPKKSCEYEPGKMAGRKAADGKTD